MEIRHGEIMDEVIRRYIEHVKVSGEEKQALEREMRHMEAGHIQSSFENTTAGSHRFQIAYGAEKHSRIVMANIDSINECIAKIKELKKQLENRNAKWKKRGLFSLFFPSDFVETEKLYGLIGNETSKVHILIDNATSAVNKEPVFEEDVVKAVKKLLGDIKSKTSALHKAMYNTQMDMENAKHPVSLDSIVEGMKALDLAINEFPILVQQTVSACITEATNQTAIAIGVKIEEMKKAIEADRGKPAIAAAEENAVAEVEEAPAAIGGNHNLAVEEVA